MKQLYIIAIIILIAVATFVYYELNKDELNKDDEIETITSSIKEETISQHFTKMFKDVSPWPGVSQASQKSKQEISNFGEQDINNLGDDGIVNNLVDNGYAGVFTGVDEY